MPPSVDLFDGMQGATPHSSDAVLCRRPHALRGLLFRFHKSLHCQKHFKKLKQLHFGSKYKKKTINGMSRSEASALGSLRTDGSGVGLEKERESLLQLA